MSLRRNHDHWSTMGNPLLLEETPMHVSLQTPCTYHWRPPWTYNWRPPCTYHWRPPWTYHWRPPDSRWRPQISLETPDFRWRPQIFVGMKVGLQQYSNVDDFFPDLEKLNYFSNFLSRFIIAVRSSILPQHSDNLSQRDQGIHLSFFKLN